MTSPWDPAIAQALQRHGGSNRSIPRTQSTPGKKELFDGTAVIPRREHVPGPGPDELEPSDKPDIPAA